MKIEFEIPQCAIDAAINQAVGSFLSVNSYGEVRGNLSGPLRELVTEMAANEVKNIDLRSLVADEVRNSLVPTIKQQIQKTLASEARKIVKAALEEKSE